MPIFSVSDCKDDDCSEPSGPATDFSLRVYPIREDDIVRIESKIIPSIITNNKEQIEADLGALSGSDIIVHEVLNRESGGSEIIVHGWSNQVVKPPQEIISSITSSSELQEQFVRDYQITCVGCDLDGVEIQDTQTYLIIIGVLSGCLLATILISLLIIRSMRNKFANRQHAADVFNDVNAGTFLSKNLRQLEIINTFDR